MVFDGRVDIHCGGIDLKFPHHENESAQIEAIQKHNLSNYWLHAEHLNMDDEKMSKSLGNFIGFGSFNPSSCIFFSGFNIKIPFLANSN